MPLLGSKRRKTEPDTQTAQIDNAECTPERSLAVDTSKIQNGPRSAPLRAKASSPQLLPRTTGDGSQRPGLNKNFSRSWYGSWNNKASPTAEVARESISVSGGLTSESSSIVQRQNSTQYMHSSLRRPRKSLPLTAEATTVNATGSSGEVDKRGIPSSAPVAGKADSAAQSKKSEETLRSDNQPDEIPKNGASDERTQMKELQGAATWFGWWSRPDGYAASDAGKSKDGEDNAPKPPDDLRKQGNSEESPTEPLATPAENSNATIKPKPSFISETAERPPEPTSRAWFGLWSASQNPKVQEQDEPAEGDPKDNITNVPKLDPKQPTVVASSESKDANAAAKQATGAVRARAESDAAPKSSGWAFWSKDKPGEQAADPESPQKRLGEIAVADTPSQSHPEAAQFNEGPDSKAKEKKGRQAKRAMPAKEVKVDQSAAGTADKISKDNKTVKRTLIAEHAFATSAKSASTTSLPLPDMPKSEDKKKEEAKITPATKALKAQQQQPNLIEPSFAATYPKAHVPSYWETLGYYLAYPLGLAPTVATNSRHVNVAPYKPKIKNAIAIGVHGYFPAPLIQKVIGQPTGTSIRFATHAAAAIRSWVEKNQPDIPCQVEQVALEGEGFISDRVATLWKLLLNWLTHLRNADLILVAAHSQGVPVAVMLVAKLIQLGCLNPNAKLAICAMAGVNLGPFADYKSRFFGGSAAELFEFSRPDSRVSREYASAVELVLRHNVRITYIGSLDDQLVSLESSLFSNLTHPYVQRAVFVDGRLHAPDFITHLVSFALKLRNLGISDHGLIRELSLPLAGSIYSGEGHSRIYDDDDVYALALQFGLETTDVDPKSYHRSTDRPSLQDRRRSSEQRRSLGGIPATTGLANSIRRGSMSAANQPGIPPQIAPYETPAGGAAANPYFLPWAMRGIMEEEEVKGRMRGEVDELVREFEEWRPVSKALRDVRYRLEGVKSRL
ncbi:Translocation protein sec63 [Sphaceloma murrayae]|uniref:Translocation protein sec63 n=1 Tax=Sphaceloma murrayae TaxID=2082308 RepID=A0A2K1QRA6_9PEZI|nr:Translocation protein sec63 [Sphaceloma murrayae]